MEINLPKQGKYVLAVSGGVDSMCLLHLLSQKRDMYELVVAHFDHGIRPDSHLDAELVRQTAKQYGLSYLEGNGFLGDQTSEAKARRARYDFLFAKKDEVKADAIVTAHHQDDRLETLVINLARGTGRKGLSSLTETTDIKRPFLNVTKAELSDYAHQHKLSWREDSTNADSRYLRNYIRQQLATKLTNEDKSRLIELMDRQEKINQQIDRGIDRLYAMSGQAGLRRKFLADLTYNESRELVAYWLRHNNLVNFDHKTIERITVAAKTKKPGARVDVYGKRQVIIGKEFLALDAIER